MEVIYQSISSPELSVSFPYDYENKPRNHKMELMVSRNVNFKDHFLKLDSEKDTGIINMLDNHRGNTVNDGSSFRRVSLDLGATLAVNEGKTFAVMPEEGLLAEDLEHLKYLANLKPNMPPNTIHKVVKIMQEVCTRFCVAGIPKVDVSMRAKRVYARTVEILETLEERGIWKDGDTEGEGSSGPGKKED